MFKNKNPDKSLNLCGARIAKLRQALPGRVSQRALAERMQLRGIDLGKNAIQQIEAGKRFVTDIELRAFAEELGVDPKVLLYDD